MKKLFVLFVIVISLISCTQLVASASASAGNETARACESYTAQVIDLFTGSRDLYDGDVPLPIQEQINVLKSKNCVEKKLSDGKMIQKLANQGTPIIVANDNYLTIVMPGNGNKIHNKFLPSLGIPAKMNEDMINNLIYGENLDLDVTFYIYK
jgi:hypothetical protein